MRGVLGVVNSILGGLDVVIPDTTGHPYNIMAEIFTLEADDPVVQALKRLEEQIGTVVATYAEHSSAAKFGRMAALSALKRMEAMRAARARHFGDNLFADPAWDILIDLAVRRLEGRQVSVSSACLGAKVPTTTAMRWLRRLVKTGLVRRYDDPQDARRTYVEINDSALAAMIKLTERLSPGGIRTRRVLT